MKLKGLKRSEQVALVDVFQKKTGMQSSLISPTNNSNYSQNSNQSNMSRYMKSLQTSSLLNGNDKGKTQETKGNNDILSNSNAAQNETEKVHVPEVKRMSQLFGLGKRS